MQLSVAEVDSHERIASRRSPEETHFYPSGTLDGPVVQPYGIGFQVSEKGLGDTTWL